MKTVCTDYFRYEELSQEAQAKALEVIRNQDSGYLDVWDLEEYSLDLLSASELPDLKANFLVGDRGEGVNLYGTIDDLSAAIFAGLKEEHKTVLAAFEEIDLQPFTAFQTTRSHVTIIDSDNSFLADLDTQLSYYEGDTLDEMVLNAELSYKDIISLYDDALALQNAIEQTVCNFAHTVLSKLRDQLEYKYSDEYTKETIEANDFHFTKDGANLL